MRKLKRKKPHQKTRPKKPKDVHRAWTLAKRLEHRRVKGKQGKEK